MVYSMGNMGYFEICQITPKILCHNCLTYWTKCIENCTCGTRLRPSDKVRKLNKDRFGVLSIPNYVIKKGPSHNARHRNTERGREEGYKSILDRFLKSLRYRKSQLNIGWNEEFCARYDAIAVEDHSCIATASERLRCEHTWVLVLNSSGPDGPMNQREDNYQWASSTTTRSTIRLAQ